MDISFMVGKDVEFTTEALRQDNDYCEPYMRGTIDSITTDIDCYVVKINFKKYDEYNKRYETSDYYDKNGIPCLTARQAGSYNEISEYYFDKIEYITELFKILDTDTTKIYSHYLLTKSENQHYVEWLEEQYKLK